MLEQHSTLDNDLRSRMSSGFRRPWLLCPHWYDPHARKDFHVAACSAVPLGEFWLEELSRLRYINITIGLCRLYSINHTSRPRIILRASLCILVVQDLLCSFSAVSGINKSVVVSCPTSSIYAVEGILHTIDTLHFLVIVTQIGIPIWSTSNTWRACASVGTILLLSTLFFLPVLDFAALYESTIANIRAIATILRRRWRGRMQLFEHTICAKTCPRMMACTLLDTIMAALCKEFLSQLDQIVIVMAQKAPAVQPVAPRGAMEHDTWKAGARTGARFRTTARTAPVMALFDPSFS